MGATLENSMLFLGCTSCLLCPAQEFVNQMDLSENQAPRYPKISWFNFIFPITNGQNLSGHPAIPQFLYKS